MPEKPAIAKENQKIRRIFENVNTIVIFVSQAYGHCESYFTSDPEILNFINSEPIKFGRMTQQFFMVVQFCKLFENSSRKGQGDSSLFNLNEAIYHSRGPLFLRYDEVRTELEQVKNSDSYLLFKSLRDKTYAHSDKNLLNLQLKFRFLTEVQVKDFKTVLIKTIEIVNLISRFYGTDTTFHNFHDSSTPANFLKGCVRNREFFKKYIKEHADFIAKP